MQVNLTDQRSKVPTLEIGLLNDAKVSIPLYGRLMVQVSRNFRKALGVDKRPMAEFEGKSFAQLFADVGPEGEDHMFNSVDVVLASHEETKDLVGKLSLSKMRELSIVLIGILLETTGATEEDKSSKKDGENS